MAPDRARGSLGTRRFAVGVGGIALVALTFRLVYVFAMKGREIAPDGFAYLVVARKFADGAGFVNALTGRPDANHPPLWSIVLSALAVIGHPSVFAAQVLSAVLGTATVVMVGVAGRRLATEGVGLLAAGIAAVDPGLWVFEQRVLSETLLFLGVALLVLLAYRYVDRPTQLRVALLGGCCGILALVRAEQILLVPFLLAPLVLGWRWSGITRARVVRLAIGCVVAAIVVSPWIVYNLSRFDEPVLLSSTFGSALAQGNCDRVYSGAHLGSFDFACFQSTARDAAKQGASDPFSDSALRRQAIRYMRDHAGRLPIVSIARQGRTWSLYRPLQTLQTQAQFPQNPWWPRPAALVVYWLLVPAAALGAFVLHRRRVRLVPLVAPFVIAVVTVAMTYGEPRLRAGAEVPLVLLAAVGLVALARRLRRRTSRGQETAEPDRRAAPVPVSPVA